MFAKSEVRLEVFHDEHIKLSHVVGYELRTPSIMFLFVSGEDFLPFLKGTGHCFQFARQRQVEVQLNFLVLSLITSF